MMRTIILLTLAVLSIQQNSRCDILVSQTTRVFNAPNENQALDLSKYFSGYNLQYRLEKQNESISLIPPFYLSDQIKLPNPVPQGFKRVGLDILTDQNLAWRDKAASLIINGTSSFIVAYADITENVNLNFVDKVQKSHSTPVRCFDLSIVSKDLAVVDCQLVDDSKGIIDWQYIVNRVTGKADPTPIPSVAKTTARKVLTYTLEDDIFILSANLYEGVEDKFKSQTYITVNRYDPLTNSVALSNIIDASSLGASTLKITDITQDQNNFIYITDSDTTIYRFKYSATGQIYQQRTYHYHDPSDQFLKVASIVSLQGKTRTFVGSANAILEILWDSTSSTPYIIYDKPSIDKMVDFQINPRMIMVQSTTDYYFYKIGSISNDELLYKTSSQGSIGILSQVYPQAIVVGDLRSLSYIISNGYLQINNPPQDLNITVIAKSKSDDQEPKECSLQFFVSAVQNFTKVYQLQDSSTNITIQNPAKFTWKISDYVIGPQLVYTSQPSPPPVVYTIKHIDDINLQGPADGFTFLDSYSIDSDNYYRMSSSDTALQIDICSFSQSALDLKCNSVRRLDVGGQLIAYSVFKVVNAQGTNFVIGFVTSNQNRVVRFCSLYKDFCWKDLQISPDYAVTDLDVNSDFIYVTSGEAKAIYVYKTQLGFYTPVVTISQSTMRDVLHYDKIFKPRQLGISPVDDNILLVKNINSIIILRITNGRVFLISDIEISEAVYGVDQRLVVGRQNFLLVRAKYDIFPSRIREYGIFDIYRPLLMREIYLYNQDISYPVKVKNSFGGEFVYVRTNFIDQPNDYQVTVLRMARPTLGANWAIFTASQNSGFVAMDKDGQSIIQIDNVPGNAPTTSKRLYYEPTITVEAKIEENTFKKDLPIGIKVESPTDSLTISTNIQVVNYQATITAKGNSTTVKLPRSTNGDLVVNLDIDGLFDGSVSKYSLVDAKWQPDKLRIVNHISAVYNTSNDRLIYQYKHFKKDKRLWVLSSNQIVITDQNGSVQAAISLGTGFDCKNWLFVDQLTVLVHCSGSIKGEQSFLKVVAENDHSAGSVTATFPITLQYIIPNPHKLVYVGGSRLFVLDSDQGNIFVFKTDATISTLAGQAKVTADSFDQIGERLNDMEVVYTFSTPDRALLITTIDKRGIGYGIFDQSADTLTFTFGKLILKGQSKLDEYQLQFNNYLQLELLMTTRIQTRVLYDLVMTTAHGQHLQLQLSFDITPQKIVFKDFSVVNIFSKYGKEQVVNWATIHRDINVLNYMAIGYYDQSFDVYSLAAYQLRSDQTNGSIIFKAAVTVHPAYKDGIRLPPTGYFFNASDDQIRFITAHPQAKSLTVYRVSEQVQLVFNYNQQGDFDSITVNASNLLSSCSQKIGINFEPNPQPTPDSSGLKWYVIVAIAVAVLLIVGVAAFFYIRSRRNRLRAADKESLLTENKGSIDTQI